MIVSICLTRWGKVFVHYRMLRAKRWDYYTDHSDQRRKHHRATESERERDPFCGGGCCSDHVGWYWIRDQTRHQRLRCRSFSFRVIAVYAMLSSRSNVDHFLVASQSVGRNEKNINYKVIIVLNTARLSLNNDLGVHATDRTTSKASRLWVWLVWIGSFICLLGCLITFDRRVSISFLDRSRFRDELIK